jgi:hypothetical protein
VIASGTDVFEVLLSLFMMTPVWVVDAESFKPKGDEHGYCQI